MKKFFNCLGAFAILLMLCLASCTNDTKVTKLLGRIPADADVVAVGNIKTIIESAGGSIEDNKIKLPSYIADEIPSAYDELDELNDFLKNSGVDPDVCAMVVNYKDGKPTMIFYLDDKKKFMKAIKDDGFREKSDDNGIVLYSKKVYESTYSEEYDEYSYIAVKDSYAYMIENVWVGSDLKPARAFERFIDDASYSPYSKTAFAGYITSGNAAGASFKIPRELRQELRKQGLPSSMINMYEGVICMKGSLTSDQMAIDFKWFDENGKAKVLKDVESAVNLKARINPDALSYFSKDEMLVYAISLKDIEWDKMLDAFADAAGISGSDKATISVAKGYLENIDGTIAMGFGLTNGMESIFNLRLDKDVLEQFAFTMVVETKDGKAKSLMNDSKDMLEAFEVPINSNSKGFSLNIPHEQGTIYAEYDGNYIILSNQKIRKGNNDAVKSLDFKDYISAGALSINKSNKLFQDLGIKNDVEMSIAANMKDMSATITMKVKGGNSEGFIAKIARIILDINAQGKSIESKYRQRIEEERGYSSYYDDYGDYDYDDYNDIVVEEIAEEVIEE